MITREQVVSLYQCILGREPESESAIEGTRQAYSTLSQAREAFLASAEFVLQRGRLFQSNGTSAGGAAERCRESLAALKLVAPAKPRASTPRMIPFGELDDLVRIVGSRLRAQVVLAYGGHQELALAFDMLQLGGIFPALVVSSRGIRDRGRDLAQWIADRGLEQDIVLVQKDQPFTALTSTFEAAKLSFELMVVSDPAISTSEMTTLFRMLSFCGVIVVDFHFPASKAAFEGCAAQLHIDPVVLGRYGLLQRTAWYTPLTVPSTLSTRASARPPAAKTLALAAIVKNEAAKVETMLRSCIPVVDCVVVVDTGSSDETMAIAERTVSDGGKRFVSSEIAFQSFAHARNTALDLVPADIDWILMLDADEYLVESDYDKLLQLLESDVDAWMLPRYNFFDDARLETPAPYPDRQRRLFRNIATPAIRYAGRVHETPANVKTWGVAPANLAFFGGDYGGPHIYHTGQVKLTRDRWEAKNAFYGSLMRVEP